MALDAGLVHFAPEAAAHLTQMPGVKQVNGRPALTEGIVGESARETVGKPVPIDLYQHVTRALTGQWKRGPNDGSPLHTRFAALRGLPFWCSVVSGLFAHTGTTSLFRELMTGDTGFSRLSAVQGRPGANFGPGDCGDRVQPERRSSRWIWLCSTWIGRYCRHCGRAWEHGCAPESGRYRKGRQGQGLSCVWSRGRSESLRAWVQRDVVRPAMMNELRTLGLDVQKVWPGLPPDDWTFWNAQLFRVATAWICARWRHTSGTVPLAKTGDALFSRAAESELSAPTEAASRLCVASLIFRTGGAGGGSRPGSRRRVTLRRESGANRHERR